MPPSPDLVFDAEALVALFFDEEGADEVRQALKAPADGVHRGFLNDVNAAEVWYTLKRRAGAELANDHLDWIFHEARLRPVTSEETWQRAARIKADHCVSLGDSFALATGQLKACAVMTGRDLEFEAGRKIGVDVRRIREPH